ncbi:MAG: hypothetical protein ACRCVN_07010 [Spirochaetia bacterium]
MLRFPFFSKQSKIMLFIFLASTLSFLVYANQIIRFDLRSIAVEAEILPLEIPPVPVEFVPDLKIPSITDIPLDDQNLTHLEFLHTLAEEERVARGKDES